MNTGKTLFAQLMDFLPWKTFHRIVDRCDGDRYVQSLTCAEQFRVMAFAPLTYRESLRDIAVCLSAQSSKLYHMRFNQETAIDQRTVATFRSFGIHFLAFVRISRLTELPLSTEEASMLEFLRTLHRHGDIAVRLPGLLLAFVIAELFYKFHSFMLECGAFLVTWLVIDLVIDRLARWMRRPGTEDSR